MLYEKWFSTPIWIHDLKLNDTELSEMYDFCLCTKAITPGRNYSNIGGWQSDDIVDQNIKNTPLHHAFKQITPLLQDCMVDLGSPMCLDISNAWININNKNHWNYAHTHSGSILSGVFYITNSNSDIEFIKDPDISTYLLDNLSSNRQTDISFKAVRYKPVRSQLLIFPSWLRHLVHASESDSERISISFNTYIAHD